MGKIYFAKSLTQKTGRGWIHLFPRMLRNFPRAISFAKVLSKNDKGITYIPLIQLGRPNFANV